MTILVSIGILLGTGGELLDRNIISALIGLVIVLGLVIGICLIPYLIASKREKSEKILKEAQQAARRAEEAEALRQKREQAIKSECAILAKLQDQSRELIFSLNSFVSDANNFLLKAEGEFSESAFAPFWDEIERATNKLAAYHQGVNQINDNATEYATRSRNMPVNVPVLEIQKNSFPDARITALHLSKIVRMAQKDFHFATIFEQRKTNQLLHAGFGTLASAIYQMHDSISGSLESLSDSLHTGLYDLLSEVKHQTKLMDNLVDNSDDSVRAQRSFEKATLAEIKKQSKILENTQRGKKL